MHHLLSNNGSRGISLSSQVNYTKVARRLVRFWRRTLDDSKPEALRQPDSFVSWLERRRTTVTPATWRMDRAALVWALTNIDETDGDEALYLLASNIGRGEYTDAEMCHVTHLRGTIKGLTTQDCLRRARAGDPHMRTSAKKLRAFSDKHRKATQKQLARRESGHDLALSVMLEATTILGLRPKEWFGAKLVTLPEFKNEPALLVPNAKNSYGRSHGTHRTIRLGNLSEPQLDFVRAHVANVKHTADNLDQWKAYVRRLSERLSKVTSMLWQTNQRRPTLYSARHQFAANCKASGMTLVELATLMGHASTNTVSCRYGRTHWGKGEGSKVRAHPDEVARVRASERQHRIYRQRPSTPKT